MYYKIEHYKISKLLNDSTVPYLSNLQRPLDLPLIIFKIELDLSWPKNYQLSEMIRTDKETG